MGLIEFTTSHEYTYTVNKWFKIYAKEQAKVSIDPDLIVAVEKRASAISQLVNTDIYLYGHDVPFCVVETYEETLEKIKHGKLF